jgi:hypothetical protein
MKIVKSILLFIAVFVISMAVVFKTLHVPSEPWMDIIIALALASLIVFVWKRINKRYLEK